MPEAPLPDISRCLAVLPLFSAIEPAAIDRLARGSALRRCSRGEWVLRVGEPCEAVHAVVVGQVKLFVVSAAGHEKVIELIGRGGSFGEALMFLGAPCVVNAQTLADTLLLSVPRRLIDAELERDRRFALRMLAGLSRRLHGLVQDVQAQALQSGAQRVIGYLLRELASDLSDDEDLGDATPRTVSLPVSKATLASRLSLTPEYFSRVLRELEDAGLIEVDRRDIRIPHRQRLAAYPG